MFILTNWGTDKKLMLIEGHDWLLLTCYLTTYIGRFQSATNIIFLSMQVSNYLSLLRKINSKICTSLLSHRFTILNKNLFLNLNILDIRCDSKVSIKEQCSCISIAVASKVECLGKKKQKQHAGYCISVGYWRVHLRWGTWKRREDFQLKYIFGYVFSKPSKCFNVKTSSK